jgi:hypothetical protein
MNICFLRILNYVQKKLRLIKFSWSKNVKKVYLIALLFDKAAQTLHTVSSLIPDF